MEIEKIFTDLESNQTFECEEAKKKLVQLLAQNKETWIVHYMMDYYLKTGSHRLMEVLVKVQSPHDGYIFDRLVEWLKTHRVEALNLFCFIVRKHPTWLFRVEKHRLIRDIFKLMTTEKEMVPLMSALVSIVTLLPIIPNLKLSFLNELFDVFGHLASWNCQNPNRLPDDKLVHLQLGLQMLFHLLYGMYPCNFLKYLSDFIKNERGAIFHHTIKPLLETVRVHPMLVTATITTELNNTRWKEMEPHDVVVECAKLSLPELLQDFRGDNAFPLTRVTSADYLDTAGNARSTNFTNNAHCCTIGTADHFCERQNKQCAKRGLSAVIWSPTNEITSSGPIPLTPTPSYMLSQGTSSAATTLANNLNNQIVGAIGSSPPEAAVEATPETTPMKDVTEIKHSTLTAVTQNSHTVHSVQRAIFASSQPSSPMRKEQSHFNFPDTTSDSTNVELEISSYLTARHPTTIDRRVQQIIQDRTNSQFQTIELHGTKDGHLSPNEIISKLTASDPEKMLHTTLVPTPELHITKTCDDCNETDQTMCTAGGLHMPTSRTMLWLAKDKRRNRLVSYCYNDSSWEKISASKNNLSDEDSSGGKTKLRRTKSCSVLSGNPILQAESVQSQEQRRLQKSGKILAFETIKKPDFRTVSSANKSSQTIEYVPPNYENSLFEMLVQTKDIRYAHERNLLYPQEILDQYIFQTIGLQKDNFSANCRIDQEQCQLLCLQLQYERYRREIHAERNRRLMGRSRDKRSLELERDRLREQIKNFATKNKELVLQIDKSMKTANEREQMYREEIADLKTKLQSEIDQNKSMRLQMESLHVRLADELTNRKTTNYEMEMLRGQIFNTNTELQQAQVQIDIGMQCKQELARLETEFIVMGEVQVKCRDRLAEMDNYKARDGELQMLQESYNFELRDTKEALEEKSSQLESSKHKISELQAQLVCNEKVITEQKRVLKAVKDEYDEKFKVLNKKYDVQKRIILQMEEKFLMSQYKPQTSLTLNACSPDTDKTDIASSMDHNSPLSTSLASSESLSASLRSTELRNLQHLVETSTTIAGNRINVIGSGANIIDGTRIPGLDFASSADASNAGTSSVSGINMVPSSSISVAAASHNFDASAVLSSHTHPHLHLQQQKQQYQD